MRAKTSTIRKQLKIKVLGNILDSYLHTIDKKLVFQVLRESIAHRTDAVKDCYVRNISIPASAPAKLL